MLWFLLAVVALFVVMAIAVGYESGTIATVLLIGALIVGYFLPFTGNYVPLFTFVAEHPIGVILAVLLYFTIGIAYSFLKWYYLIVDYRDAYPDYKVDRYPKAKDEVPKILRWTCYWPLSFWITLIHRPLRTLIKKLGYAYDAMTAKIVGIPHG